VWYGWCSKCITSPTYLELNKICTLTSIYIYMALSCHVQKLVRYHKYRETYISHLPQRSKIGSEGSHSTEWSQGTPSQPWADSTSEDSSCSCTECKMTLLCHCGLEAKVVEHHDNYRRAYACCPKRVMLLFLPFPYQTFAPISHLPTPSSAIVKIQVVLFLV